MKEIAIKKITVILSLLLMGVLFYQEKVLAAPRYDSMGEFQNGVAIVKGGNNKYGLINKRGVEIVKLGKYDYIGEFSEGYAKVEKDDGFGIRAGFIDMNGKEVIRLKYYNVFRFSGGMAAFYDYPGKWGFINKKGEEVIKPQFDYPLFWEYEFSDGLARVIKDNKWVIINKKGKVVFKDKKNESILGFNEGLGIIKKNEKYGFINKKGKVVIKPKYDRAYLFSKGLAMVEKGGLWGFINKKGKEIIKPKYREVYQFNKGIALVKNALYMGFVDKNGKEVIKPKYTVLGEFSEGLAFAGSGNYRNNIGCINFKEKQIIEPEYASFTDFKNGIAGVAMADGENSRELRWGFIDKKGKTVIKFEYDKVINLGEGLVACRKKDVWFLMNTKGKLIKKIK